MPDMSANNIKNELAPTSDWGSPKSVPAQFDMKRFSEEGAAAFSEGNAEEQSYLYDESLRAAEADGVDIVSRKHVELARTRRRAEYMPAIFQYLGNIGFLFLGVGLEPFMSGEVSTLSPMRLYIVGLCLAIGGILSALQMVKRR